MSFLYLSEFLEKYRVEYFDSLSRATLYENIVAELNYDAASRAEWLEKEKKPLELLQKLLKEMVNRGLAYAVLEVTSHGIEQERIAGVEFHTAVVTNVTHEHLDYHKTYKAYLKTKSRLFGDVQFGVLNRDDSSYNYLRSVTSGKTVGYGLRDSSEIMAKDIRLADDSVRFGIHLNTSSLHSDEVFRFT